MAFNPFGPNAKRRVDPGFSRWVDRDPVAGGMTPVRRSLAQPGAGSGASLPSTRSQPSYATWASYRPPRTSVDPPRSPARSQDVTQPENSAVQALYQQVMSEGRGTFGPRPGSLAAVLPYFWGTKYDQLLRQAVQNGWNYYQFLGQLGYDTWYEPGEGWHVRRKGGAYPPSGIPWGHFNQEAYDRLLRFYAQVMLLEDMQRLLRCRS